MAAGGFGGILFPKSSSDDRPTPGLSDTKVGKGVMAAGGFGGILFPRQKSVG